MTNKYLFVISLFEKYLVLYWVINKYFFAILLLEKYPILN